MLRTAVALGSCLGVSSQQAGTEKDNYNLPLPIQHCTADGCTEEATSVTMDANWRWMHEAGGYENCFTDGRWSASACSSGGAECASKCAIEGLTESDWSDTYGISQRSGGLRLNFKTKSNVGSRIYLLDADENYKQFSLKNREITFDVDVSKLPCGMNGAVYFSEMPADGDKGSTNTAGAPYGTGYCDAQCPSDVKFISGEANSEGWGTSETGRATGKFGSCCAEMDLWEANKEATAFTAHPCSVDKLYRCEGAECKTICDMPGCDFNSYRMGAHDFYGPGRQYEVNTLKPFTIVTQFITVDGSDDGDLSEIRRFYIQDGRRIENSKATVDGLRNQSSLSDSACTADKHIFGESDTTGTFGGMKQMGAALGRGMTLVLSLWDDGESNMHWLDSRDPVWENPVKPGVLRGPCSTDVGNPNFVRSHYSSASVDYFNVKYGELGSTTSTQSNPTPEQRPTRPAPKPRRKPVRMPPEHVPVSAPGLEAGKCCYGGCSGTCKTAKSWCAKSKSHCEGACAGQWCPVSSGLSQVKRHRQLRGGDHLFIQKLLRLSLSKTKSPKSLNSDSEEL